MGIPKFFAWLSQQCPQMIHPLSSDSIVDVDNLYLDMNGVVHQCKQGAVASEEELLMATFQYIEGLVDIVRPKKYLFIALDGVAPRAKQSQQRQRRWRSYAKKTNQLAVAHEEDAAEEAETERKGAESITKKETTADTNELTCGAGEWQCPACTYVNEPKVHHCAMCNGPPEVPLQGTTSDGKPNTKALSSISITPGTAFMQQLSKYFHYFIRKKMEHDWVWRRCTVIFSGSEVPGEGEHKIMDFIRERRNSYADYSPHEVHSLYGMDADLIMLALASHEPKFTIFREFVNTAPRTRNRRGKARFRNLEETFQLLDIPILRSYIDKQFSDVKSQIPFSFDLERIIDDFVLMLFLCGNDFLPHIPTLDIGEGALQYFFGLYKQILPSLQGYITETNEAIDHGTEQATDLIHFDRLEKFLTKIAELEEEVLNKRAELSVRQFKKKRWNKRRLVFSQMKKLQAQQTRNSISAVKPPTVPQSSSKPSPGGMPQCVDLADFINLSQCECLNIKEESALKSVLQVTEENQPIELSSDSDEQLVIKISFKERVKIQSFTIFGPEQFAPRTVKLFVNKPDMGFEDVEEETEDQQFELNTTDTSEDYTGDQSDDVDITQARAQQLKATKFRTVSHLTIFISDNQGNKDVTKISQLAFFGLPLATTDISKLQKRPRRTRGRRDNASQTKPEPRKPTEDEKRALDQADYEIGEQIRSDVLIQSLKPHSKAQVEAMFSLLPQEDDNIEQAEAESKSRFVVDHTLWRANYYCQNFDGGNGQSSPAKAHIIRSYVEGIAWIFRYYYQGCPSWEWYYPYHYAPLASDLLGTCMVDASKEIKFNIGKPMRPFEQLLSVLPPDSAGLLPAAYRPLMTSASSPLAQFYPSQVKIDSNGKKNDWEHIVLVPFVDLQLLRQAIRDHHVDSQLLTPEEQQRNGFGCAYKFVYNDDDSSAYAFASPSQTLAAYCLPEIKQCHISCEPLASSTFLGDGDGGPHSPI